MTGGISSVICVADKLFGQSSRLVVVHFAVMNLQEMYFERQVGEQCVVHLINNAVGGQVLLAADMLGVAAEIVNRHNAHKEFLILMLFILLV